MDQNLDFGASGMIFGTRIAVELRRKGFKGIVAIMSANSSRLEEDVYLKVPGVDCVCGKHLAINNKKARITTAWHKKAEQLARERLDIEGGNSFDNDENF